jgi:dihydropteroate synthase
MQRPVFDWRLASRTLRLGERTLVMGILNVTPDSFSDGGQFHSSAEATDHGLRMLDEGADILDVGGESTRPGKKEPVSETTELERVLPVIRGLLHARTDATISIDTYKAGVARKALDSGAQIVNDVSGFQWDSNIAEVIAEHHCGAVLMHMRGRPETWRDLPPLADPLATVKKELAYYAGVALKFGVPRECIVLDPGFGFGKNFDENYPLLARFAELHTLGFPLLSGTSRKSFLGRTLGNAAANERLFGSMATVTASILAGAHIVRVHDVKPAVETAQVADAILRAAVNQTPA